MHHTEDCTPAALTTDTSLKTPPSAEPGFLSCIGTRNFGRRGVGKSVYDSPGFFVELSIFWWREAKTSLIKACRMAVGSRPRASEDMKGAWARAMSMADLVWEVSVPGPSPTILGVSASATGAGSGKVCSVRGLRGSKHVAAPGLSAQGGLGGLPPVLRGG